MHNIEVVRSLFSIYLDHQEKWGKSKCTWFRAFSPPLTYLLSDLVPSACTSSGSKGAGSRKDLINWHFSFFSVLLFKILIKSCQPKRLKARHYYTNFVWGAINKLMSIVTYETLKNSTKLHRAKENTTATGNICWFQTRKNIFVNYWIISIFKKKCEENMFLFKLCVRRDFIQM